MNPGRRNSRSCRKYTSPCRAPACPYASCRSRNHRRCLTRGLWRPSRACRAPSWRYRCSPTSFWIFESLSGDFLVTAPDRLEVGVDHVLVELLGERGLHFLNDAVQREEAAHLRQGSDQGCVGNCPLDGFQRDLGGGNGMDFFPCHLRTIGERRTIILGINDHDGAIAGSGGDVDDFQQCRIEYQYIIG